MARQDLIVVALVFIAVVGAFATNKSSSQTPSKASSPAKSPSSSSSASSTKSSSDGRAPKSSLVGAPKRSSFDAESVEDVSSPPSPNVTDKVLSLLHALKSKGNAVDSESPNSNNDSPAPTPFNSDATKAIIGIVNIVVVTGFFLF
ncbi:hypothetical protein ES319_A02G171600v1 [Gossypium barbadense]|uniref:Uncharacterized protein n=1 Tax=Gossypium barbadense TaxID=3634 RepID=A0A5J5WSW1_GOSBA|nr:hypothetical protein ES319_A02G171600v1 [Gossypium barbadense]